MPERLSSFPWLLLGGLYAPVFFQLYKSRWETVDYTHAYFILPAALWIVWTKRGALKGLLSASKGRLADGTLLSCVAAGLLLFVFGWRQDFLVLTSFSLIPVAWGLTGFLYGVPVAKALAFPFSYLFFLIPPPLGLLDAVTMPMRYAILSATEVILRMVDYPIQRSGLLMTMDGKEIFMGAPCSGFRSLITMFALASIYVYVTKGGAGKKALLLFSVIPLTMMGNLLRVISLCLLTHYAGKEAAEGFLHTLSGAVVFLFVVGCFVALEHLIDRFGQGNENAY